MISKENIESVLSDLLANIDEDKRDQYRDISHYPFVMKAADLAKRGNVEGFFYAFVYPLSEMIDGLLSAEVPQNQQAHFIFKHYDFVKSHFRFVFENVEGSACSVDKAKTVIKALLNFYLYKKEVSFDYDQEYTFHLPCQVFKEHNEVVSFFTAIYSLYYGNPLQYIEALLRLKNNQSAKTEENSLPK